MLGKNNQFMNQKKFGRKFEKYAIKKLRVGVASVVVGAGFFFGYHVEASVTDSGYNRTGTGNSVVADTQEFVMVTHEKPGGVVEDVAILKSKFSANLEQLKKEYPGFTATSLQSIGINKYKITYVPVAATNPPSSTTESAANTVDTGTSNSTPATTENKVFSACGSYLKFMFSMSIPLVSSVTEVSNPCFPFSSSMRCISFIRSRLILTSCTE